MHGRAGPGSFAGVTTPTLPPPAAASWAAWQALRKASGGWRAWLPTVRGVNSFDVDAVSGIATSRSGRAALAVLRPLGEVEFEGVRALATINAKRQDFYVRNVTIAYLTVPLTLAALWAQLSPTTVTALLNEPDLRGVWVGTITGLAAALVIRFIADWRARTLVALIEIAAVERGGSG